MTQALPSRLGSASVRRLYLVHQSTMPALNAPDIDISTPDSLPHACTRRAQARESLGLSAGVAQSAPSCVTQKS